MKPKIIKPLLFIMCLLLVACSKEETQINIGPDPTNAELTVKLSTTQETTLRSSGYGDNNYVETKINTAVIGVFLPDGSLSAIREASFAEGATTQLTMSVKSGFNKVYVVANVNTDLFSAVSNETQFKAVALTLDQATIPLTANTTVQIEPNETTKTDVYLERMVAKVSISTINLDFKANGYSAATFVPDKVFLHNANTKSTIDFVTSVPKSGLSESSLANVNDAGFGLYDRHYFYSFESNLKLVIGGWFKDGARDAKYVYYPISIDAKHNVHYSVTANIRSVGVNNPDDEFEASGKLDVTLKVVDWDAESVDETFE